MNVHTFSPFPVGFVHTMYRINDPFPLHSALKWRELLVPATPLTPLVCASASASKNAVSELRFESHVSVRT